MVLYGNLMPKDPPDGELPRLPPGELPRLSVDYNLINIRGPKTGSTTFSGIIRRFWDNHGTKNNKMFSSHFFDENLDQLMALPNRIVVWGIREPVSRCLSHFYHKYATSKKSNVQFNKTDAYLIETVSKDSICHDFLYKFYRNEKYGLPDLFIITDRFIESVVMAKYILNATIEDMIYISAKVSSSNVRFEMNNAYFVRDIPVEEQSPIVQRYFNSKEFIDSNSMDYSLYTIANKRLDKFIDKVGRGVFYKQVLELQRHNKIVEEKCKQTFVDAEGKIKRDECLYNDEGCGYRCINSYIKSLIN